jgi:hypothetical protein
VTGPPPGPQPAVEVAYPSDLVTRLVNPLARMLLRSPLGGPLRRRYMLIEFTGRRSGRRYTVPVTVHRTAGAPAADPYGGLYVLTSAAWRLNFRGGADVRVMLDGRTIPMRGVLVDDPGTVAPVYARRIAEYGRRMAQIEIAIKINVPRIPTVEELTEAAASLGLSVIELSGTAS